MSKERQTCVSVRLRDAEYRKIKRLAKQDDTTMSAILRKLLRNADEGSEK